ncbi:MAG: SMP-30/gluconolactonase/LRE family protein [Bacteroidia bacterium]|nr:SMP-30/gluconolactonase/LRE family protein [Bacteroidia bacterium]
MQKRFTYLFLLLVVVLGCKTDTQTDPEAEIEATTYAHTGKVERLDPTLDNLIATDAVIEILADSFDWCEGPLWLPDQQALVFSDIPPNTIFKWKEGEGKSVFVKPAGYTGNDPRLGEKGSNGLLLDPQGRLVLCQHGDRRMAVMTASLDDPRPEYETLADNYDGKRLNSPNDAAYHSSGALYFTDPPYGLENGMEDSLKEIPFQGVYRRAPDGTVSLLTDELSRPNGIAFSPDEKTLYVANSDPERAIWMAYDVQEDGSIANGRLFYDATPMVPTAKGLPDGLKVDKSGNIFATGPGGVLVFSPDGKHLGTVMTGQATSNCAFGDDGSSLYMTADMFLMRIKLKTRG